MTNEQEGKLFKIAAEMVLCKNMPSNYPEDLQLRYRDQTECVEALSRKAEKQCKQWAYEIRVIIEE